jgi:hypothetical protein
MAVDQQHRRAASPVAEANPNLPHVQMIDPKAVEHADQLASFGVGFRARLTPLLEGWCGLRTMGL